jgi:hypothetical protein
MSDAVNVDVIVVTGSRIGAETSHDGVARDLGSILTIAAWPVKESNVLSRAIGPRVIVAGVSTILSLETQTVLVNWNHTRLKYMLLEGWGNKRRKPRDRIMTLALNLSSVLLVKLSHGGRCVYHSVHDYREGGSRQPVSCVSSHVCQPGWSGD